MTTAHDPLWPAGTRILVGNCPAVVLGPGNWEDSTVIIFDGETEPCWTNSRWLVDASVPQTEVVWEGGEQACAAQIRHVL